MEWNNNAWDNVFKKPVKILGLLHPCGRAGTCSCLLDSDWPNSDHCGLLWRKLGNGTCVCAVSATLYYKWKYILKTSFGKKKALIIAGEWWVLWSWRREENSTALFFNTKGSASSWITEMPERLYGHLWRPCILFWKKWNHIYSYYLIYFCKSQFGCCIVTHYGSSSIEQNR